MAGVAIVGLQWGDEGKGKIIDCLAADADIIVRFQGGANAGHTIHVGDQKFVLHVVPAGVLYPGKACVIGNGVVIDLKGLVGELEGLEAAGIDTGRVFLSERAHLVFPFHKRLDEARENQRGEGKIGTTKRGIGPCYADKVSRVGLRVVDLYDENRFRRLLKVSLEEKNAILTALYGQEPLVFDPLFEEYRALAKTLRRRVIDTGKFLDEAIQRNERILYEGAQGVMLDVDHGTYPYVTSSSSSMGGAFSGAGVPPGAIRSPIGVLKAYTTRVGAGPFPTELSGTAAEELRQAGGEYGATTGRPRRCGYLDLVQIRYAVRISGARRLALTKLDVLSGQERLRVAVSYEHEGRITTDFPADLNVLRNVRPIFQDLPGFEADIGAAAGPDDLPPEARDFMRFVEQKVGVPVGFLSTGRQRDQLHPLAGSDAIWSD